MEKSHSVTRPEEETYPLWIFHPHEPIRRDWDIFLGLIMIYLVVDIPIKICFEVNLPLSHPWSRAELVVDCLFFLDIIFNFNTGYIDEQNMGKFVVCRRKISETYLTGWFFLDAITTIPFELFTDSVGSAGKSASSLSKVLKFVRFLRLLKLLRLLRLLHLLSQWEVQSSSSTVLSRLGKLFFLMFMVAHLAACAWVGVEMYYRQDVEHLWDNCYGFHPNSWFVRFASNSPTWEKSEPERYLRALYWAFTTLTTIGYGDITPLLPMEIAFTIAIQFIGSTLFGYIIGNVASAISHDDETILMIKEKIAIVRSFLAYRNIPPELSETIRRHYEYSWKRSQVFHEAEILGELPHAVMMDCALHIHKDIISKVPFLRSIGDDVVPSLVTRLKPVLASVGDKVLREAYIGHEMFFILNGRLVVEINPCNPTTIFTNTTGTTSKDPHRIEIQIKHIGNGECFAEYAVIMDQAKHPASVRAEEYCDMYMLSRHEFVQFGQECPIAYADLLKQGKGRYSNFLEDIFQKQEEQFQQMEEVMQMAYSAIKKANNEHNEEPAEEEEESELIKFVPGEIVTFHMRLQYHLQLLNRKQGKSECYEGGCGTRLLHKLFIGSPTVSDSKVPTEPGQDAETASTAATDTSTLNLLSHNPTYKKVKTRVVSLFLISRGRQLQPHSEDPDEAQAESEEKSNEEMTRKDIEANVHYEEGSSEGRSIRANSWYGQVQKLPWRTFMKIIAWKNRAMMAVAMRKIESVQKRHYDKFNIQHDVLHDEVATPGKYLKRRMSAVDTKTEGPIPLQIYTANAGGGEENTSAFCLQKFGSAFRLSTFPHEAEEACTKADLWQMKADLDGKLMKMDGQLAKLNKDMQEIKNILKTIANAANNR